MNRHDREYLDAFASLDPELIEQMKAAGITGPDFVCDTGFRYDNNFIDSVGGAKPFAGLDDEKICEVVRRLVGELICQSNPALAIECFSLVTGIGYLGDSMTEIGRRHGVTRAAVSKRCIEFAEALGLDSSRAMRKRKAPTRVTQRRPEVVHPHVNRVVSMFGRLRRSGWLSSQDADQLRCICADLDPIRRICNELDALVREKDQGSRPHPPQGSL
jgi:hypothetical protein